MQPINPIASALTVLLLVFVILGGGWRRRRLLKTMAARYRCRAARSPLFDQVPDSLADRPYPMAPERVLR